MYRCFPSPADPPPKHSQPRRARGGWGTSEEPQTAPGCCLSIPKGDDARALRPLPRKSRRCTMLSPPPRRAAPLPRRPAQGLFPWPGTWRGLKAGANNGLNIAGGGRAAAAGCICPGRRDEEEACTCPAASLSAGNKSNKSPSVHPQVISYFFFLHKMQSPLGSSSYCSILLTHPSLPWVRGSPRSFSASSRHGCIREGPGGYPAPPTQAGRQETPRRLAGSPGAARGASPNPRGSAGAEPPPRPRRAL